MIEVMLLSEEAMCLEQSEISKLHKHIKSKKNKCNPKEFALRNSKGVLIGTAKVVEVTLKSTGVTYFADIDTGSLYDKGTAKCLTGDLELIEIKPERNKKVGKKVD